jgi:hypothetical protein
MYNVSIDESCKYHLLFVYNGDSGLLNMLKDWIHKIVIPSTYDCQLCALTYGNTGMKKEWHRFISNLSYKTLFLHRNDFHKEYSNLKDIPLPCIFIEQEHDKFVEVLLDADTINQQKTLDQLMDTCTRSLESFTQQ